ncbi:MAG: enoyl-CoA hydratase/isomerase family protein [Alphaproteobacteria bacterium]|nr:enoyl-CoA hydratase/isomerase family protein [Alphaproteobacteria bacterium]
MNPTLHVSRPTAATVLLELDGPPANGLGMALRGQLAEVLATIDADLTVRAVVLTGRNGAFCAGDDLREAAGRGDGQLDAVLGFNVLMDQVAACRVPIIAAIDGWCLGGGLELALSCDIRLASARASFAASGVNIGLMASVDRLPRLIGEARAKAHLLTGATFDPVRALADGVVTAVHPSDALLAEALKVAERIASRAPLSVEATKRAVAGLPVDVASLVASADHAEAVAAFRAKRAGVFVRG